MPFPAKVNHEAVTTWVRPSLVSSYNIERLDGNSFQISVALTASADGVKRSEIF